MAGNLSLVFTDLLPAISVGNTKLPELSGRPPMNGLAVLDTLFKVTFLNSVSKL